ncbi:MAG: TIGR03545 family protein [Balneolaceae bacterium]
MRIGGIITVLVLIGLSFAASFFITSEWMENKIEYQASILNEAKVEIDELDFSFFNLHLKWNRLQVANSNNTMENTFETGPTEFSMEFWPLILRNKVIVDNVRLTGFELATERETDGYFEMPVDEYGEEVEPGFISEVVTQVSSEARKNAEVKFTDVRDDLNIDSLMAKVNIQSVDKIDSLRRGIQRNYTKWDSTFNNTSIEKEIETGRKSVESIKVDEIKDPKKAIEAIENVKKLRNQVDSLKTEAKQLKSEFDQDYGSTKDDLEQVDNWIEEDYQRALSVAKLPDLDVRNIGSALFGQNLLGDYASYLEYVAIAREYGSRFVSDEEDEIPRYEGLDYHFSDKYDWPGFWFKNIELSGRTNTDLVLSGTVTNISSSQKKTGEPVVFDLGGLDENEVSLSLNGEINYLGDDPVEKFNVYYSGFTLSEARLSGSDLLPWELKSGKGEVNVKLDIIGKRIDSRIDYLARDISFDFASAGAPKNKIETLIRDAIGSTDEIDVSALVDNVDGPLRVRVRSNVDDLFMNALRQTVSREIENARRKVEAEVQKRVAGKKEELEKFRDEKEAEIRRCYEELQAKVDDQIALVEQKREDLEEKKKELEKALKDKAAEELKKRIGIDF